jgi:putative N6-adenine-specific DNA methylase
MAGNPLFPLIAKTISGLEDVLAEELLLLGATEIIKLNRAVSFMADHALMYKVNYCCRTALRILKPLFHFELTDQKDLYDQIHGYSWEDVIRAGQTISIDAVISYTVFTHSQYVAQRTKDAVVDRIRDQRGSRPSVDLENADIRINVHLFRDQCTVALDSSGQSLHRRGYRLRTGPAPINEVLAAGLLRLAGWEPSIPLLDPMCGSGTILIEAAMLAAGIPAGRYRKSWGFMHWGDFDQDLWVQVRNECDVPVNRPMVALHGADRSDLAIRAARENVEHAGLTEFITLEICSLRDLKPSFSTGMILFNPPYDERIKLDDSLAFYKMIGDNLKQKFSGFTAWLISADLDSVKFIGLRPSRKIQVFNGPLECRFLKFDLFAGKKYSTTPAVS